MGLFPLLFAACSDGPLSPASDPPVVLLASAAPGPHSVLTAVVTVVVRGADSVAVRFGTGTGPLDSLTAAVRADADTLTVPVLGLRAETAYRMQAVAFGAGVTGTSDVLELTTGPLPADLPTFSAGGTAPSPGFVAFAVHPYGLVIDNSGRVVWYRRLEQGFTLNFQPQANGRYATSPVTPAAGDLQPWTEYDLLGRPMRRLGCADGLVSRFHELRAEEDGSYWILCDETRVMDLSALGGRAEAAVTGTVVQRIAPDGARLFSWSPFDHFAITDLDSASRAGPTVNWTHGNTITFDRDGDLLVSFRSLNEITKIDRLRGTVRWRLGGRANQFTAVGQVVPFVGQHGVRATHDGALQFLDNRGIPGESRAVRLGIDEVDMTVWPVRSFSSAPAVNAIAGGSTQVLGAGRLLVAYGNGNRVEEYDADGNVVWALHGNPGYIFRAQRMSSLYRPGASP